MKSTKLAVVIAIVSSVILFLVGYCIWADLFVLLLPIVGNVRYLSSDFSQGFKSSVFFGLTLALIPIATILIWKYGPVYNTQRRFFTVGIIIIAMVASVLLRREMIKSKARNMEPTTILDYSDLSNPQPKAIESYIPESELKFELFVFAGLLAGSLVSFFLLRQKQPL